MYDSSYYYGGDSYWLLSFISTYFLLALALLILFIVAEWKVFKKAGQPGWASIVPFYSTYIEYKAFWGDTRYFWYALICGLLSIIPVVGFIGSAIAIVFSLVLCYKKAQSFGQSVGFTIGLVFLPNIFNAILAFDKNMQYVGYPEKTDTEKKIDEKVNDFVQDNFSEPEETDIVKEGYVSKKDDNQSGWEGYEEPEPVTNVKDREILKVRNPQDISTEGLEELKEVVNVQEDHEKTELNVPDEKIGASDDTGNEKEEKG